MIERLIENWLTSTSERGYEAAFCQLLMAEGHRLVHIDRHTGTEHGKDIISYDQDGQLCAFQLKCGNINVAKWRNEVEPEIIELIEYPVQHPNVNGPAKPYLVTTGRINENVNGRIAARNAASTRRKFEPLTVIQGSELVSRFVSIHGRFFPQQAADLSALLKCYLADGRELLEKNGFAEFLEGILPRSFSKKTDASRAICSSLIFAAYALSPYSRCENHYALFEGWILVASYIARLAEALQLRKKLWQDSFELATDEAWYALEQVCGEATKRDA